MPKYDCFLSHNTKDKPAARRLADALRGRGLVVWLDEDELQPGLNWVDALDQALADCKSALAVVGADGQGPWQREELSALLLQAVNDKLPVIPVMLPGCPNEPALPSFLRVRGWIDLRQGLVEEALDRLVFGITGSKPVPHTVVLSPTEIKQYRNWTLARYQGVDLIGVGGGELCLPFDQVYVPLAIARRDPLTEFEHRPRSRHDLAQEAVMEEVEVAEILSRLRPGQPHAAVFGIPGCGKTTVLLKLLQLCLEQGPAALGLAADTLPLFLPLAQLDTEAMEANSPLGPILAEGLQLLAGPALPEGLGERLWRRGHLLLLLDGLDEVADEDRRASVAGYLARALTGVERRRIHALVSCRIDSYGGPVRLGGGFLPLDVRPLDDRRIEQFVTCWLAEAHRIRATDPTQAKRDAERQTDELIAALRGSQYASQQLKTLVSNPLMLTLLCLVVLRGGQLPNNRGEFYRRCLDALLTSWGKAQGREPAPLPTDTVLAVLRPLARRLHRERRKYDLTAAQFVTIADTVLAPRGLQAHGFALLAWLHREAGVLSEYAPRHFGFMHLGLQEYLCAESLSAAASDWVDELLPQLRDRQGLKWWREVVLLLAGLPDQAPFGALLRRLLEHPAEQRDLLRGCLVENPSLDLTPFLAALKSDHDPATQALVLELLAGRGDPELLQCAEPLADGPDAGVAGLARRLLEHHTPPPAREGFDLLLVHAPEDRQAAEQLARDLRTRGLEPWLSWERLSDESAWQEAQVLQQLLSDTRHVLILALSARPWEDPETRDALDLFAARGLTLLAIGERADAPAALLPRTAWLPGSGAQAMNALGARLKSEAPSAPTAGVPEIGQTYTEPHTDIRLLWIPAGSLDMGSEQLSNDERPVHRVRLSPFRLAETPVTNRQYASFLEASEHPEPEYWRDRRFSDPEQPVIGVSWEDAMAFCNWLKALSGLPVILPSEAQWEFAARGEDGRTYPWGEDKPDQKRACFGQDSENGRPDPVGSHPESRGPFGTLDQAGNVWEWCLDTWDASAYEKRKGKLPPDPVVTTGDAEYRVLRGGGWYFPAFYLQAAFRNGYPARNRYDNVGFRVAVAPASR